MLSGYPMTLWVGKRVIGRLGPSEWFDPLTLPGEEGDPQPPTTKYLLYLSPLEDTSPCLAHRATNPTHSQPVSGMVYRKM